VAVPEVGRITLGQRDALGAFGAEAIGAAAGVQQRVAIERRRRAAPCHLQAGDGPGLGDRRFGRRGALTASDQFAPVLGAGLGEGLLPSGLVEQGPVEAVDVDPDAMHVVDVAVAVVVDAVTGHLARVVPDGMGQLRVARVDAGVDEADDDRPVVDGPEVDGVEVAGQEVDVVRPGDRSLLGVGRLGFHRRGRRIGLGLQRLAAHWRAAAQ